MTTVPVEAPVAFPATNLVSVEQARAFCLRDSADESQDQLWQFLIPCVSEAAGLWTERQFAPADGVSRRVGGVGRLSFTPWELRSITSMEDSAGNDLLAAGDFLLLPIGGSSQGTWWTIDVGANVSSITIEGDWGMGEVPPSVQLACLIALDSYYRNPSAHASESLGSYSFSDIVSQWEIAGLPRASRSLLDNFRRVSVI